MWNMMSGICGIDYAPLVLGKGGSNYCIALSGNVNDNRTFGACNCNAIWLNKNTNGTQSKALGETQGIKIKNFQKAPTVRNN